MRLPEINAGVREGAGVGVGGSGVKVGGGKGVFVGGTGVEVESSKGVSVGRTRVKVGKGVSDGVAVTVSAGRGVNVETIVGWGMGEAVSWVRALWASAV